MLCAETLLTRPRICGHSVSCGGKVAGAQATDWLMALLYLPFPPMTSPCLHHRCVTLQHFVLLLCWSLFM